MMSFEITRRSSGGGRMPSALAEAPSNRASRSRSSRSRSANSTSPGPITIVRGRPVALPATSNCIRQGARTAARASADAAASSRKSSAPPARRGSGMCTPCDRTVGSTSRRRSSSSAAHGGRRAPPRPADRRLAAGASSGVTRAGRGGSSATSSSSKPGSSADSMIVPITSSSTGVCSWMPESSPRRSTSRMTAARIAQGLPARPAIVEQRLSSVIPPRRWAESSRNTS